MIYRFMLNYVLLSYLIGLRTSHAFSGDAFERLPRVDEIDEVRIESSLILHAEKAVCLRAGGGGTGIAVIYMMNQCI